MSEDDEAPASPRRRGFLALTVIGAVSSATAGAVGFWIRLRRSRRSAETELLAEPAEAMSESGQRLAAGIREQLPALVIPPATLARWVNLHEQHEGPWPRQQPRRHTVERFLLSTDFFPAADESKPLVFVAYYDPYVTRCYNPLRDTSSIPGASGD